MEQAGHKIHTAQERSCLGSTEQFDPGIYYTPGIVGEVGVEEANAARRKVGYASGMGLDAIALAKGWEGHLRMTLEPLDPTGKTIRDPRFIQGRWDTEGNLQPGARDRTDEMYALFTESGRELHRRPESNETPERTPGGPEKR